MPTTITLTGLLAGLCTQSAMPGEQVRVQTGGIISSAEGELFIRSVESLTSEVFAKLEIRPFQIESLLIIFHRNLSADVYLNEIGLRAKVQARRAVNAGESVKEGDIADIVEMKLDVQIPNDCGFAFVFSYGWRKGLCFDIAPLQGVVTRDFEVKQFLGAAYALVIAGEKFTMTKLEWNALISKGWFPFMGLTTATTDRMIDFLRSGREPDLVLEEIRPELLGVGQEAVTLAQSRTDFEQHAPFLARAIERIAAEDYISAGSILYPRVEGLLRSFHLLIKPDERPHQMRILESAFPLDLAARFSTSLLRLDWFSVYIDKVIFAGFDWRRPFGASRHTVGHGVVNEGDLSAKNVIVTLLTIHHLLYALSSRLFSASPSDD